MNMWVLEWETKLGEKGFHIENNITKIFMKNMVKIRFKDKLRILWEDLMKRKKSKDWSVISLRFYFGCVYL